MSLCVLAATFCVGPAQALPAHHARKELFKQQVADLEQQLRAATLSNDIPAMDRLLSDDYVGISWTGQVTTKTALLDHLRNRSIMLTRVDLSDANIKIVGPVAIVTSLAEIEGTNEGKPMVGMFRYTRVYRRLPSGMWKVTNFEATRLRPGPPATPNP